MFTGDSGGEEEINGVWLLLPHVPLGSACAAGREETWGARARLHGEPARLDVLWRRLETALSTQGQPSDCPSVAPRLGSWPNAAVTQAAGPQCNSFEKPPLCLRLE